MIQTVFLDMDGVLVNFNKAACAIIDVPYPPSKWHWYKNTSNGFKKVNDGCTIDFWANLEWHTGGKEILTKVVQTFGRNNVYLLTTPMPNPDSGTGKMLWVEKNAPAFVKQLIITQAPKNLFAKSDILLIDDKGQNVDEFRQAGGQTILVPRSWNSAHLFADNALEVVEQSLEKICQKP